VQLPRRNDGVEYWAFRVGRVPKRLIGFCGSRVPKRPTGYVARRHANPPTPLTRHRPCRSDKLSRLAPPSELIKRHPPCGIRSLAEGRRRGAHFAEMFGANPFFIPQDNSVADMTDAV
jgi:hypothetical protein